MSYTPKIQKLQEGGPAPLNDFLEPSREEFDATQYSPEEAAVIQKNLDRGYTLVDAQTNASERIALHTLLVGDDPDGPTNSEKVYVDVSTVAGELDKSAKYSGMDKLKWKRTLDIIDQIQSKGISIVKDDNDRYWLENNEDGVRRYSANAILEVRDLLTEFSAPGEKKEETSTFVGDTEDDEKKIESKISPEYKGGFTDSDMYTLGATGVDVISSIGAVILKSTVAGAPVGAVVSALGGLAATAMDAYSDYLNPEVTGWEAAGNAAVRIGLEATEAFTFLPVSLVARFTKGSRYVDTLRKVIHYGMVGKTMELALGMEYTELLDKVQTEGLSGLEVDDWRRLGSLASFGISAGSSMHTKSLLKKRVARNTVATDVGAPGKKLTAQNKGAVKSIKKEIAPPKKLLPKKDVVARVSRDGVAKIQADGVKSTKANAASAVKAKKQGVKDQIDLYGKKRTAHKAIKSRGKNKLVAQKKVNKEFEKKAKDLKVATKAKVADYKTKSKQAPIVATGKIAKKVESTDKAVTASRKVKGTKIKEQRGKEFNKKLKARKDKLKESEAEVKEQLGPDRGDKIIAKTKRKALGKKGKEKISKKKDPIKQTTEAKILVTNTKKRKALNDKITKSDQDATPEQIKTIDKLTKKIEADSKIVGEQAAAAREKAKTFRGKTSKKVKKGAKNLVARSKKAKNKVAVGLDTMVYGLAAKDRRSSKAAIKGVIGTTRATNLTERQHSVAFIKDKLEKNGYDTRDIDKYTDKEIREAYERAMIKVKKEAKVDKKQEGGKLIKKFQLGGYTAPIGLQLWVANIVGKAKNAYNNYDYSLVPGPGVSPMLSVTPAYKEPAVDAISGASIPVATEGPVVTETPPATPELPGERATNFDNIQAAKDALAAAAAAAVEEDPENAEEINAKYQEAIATLEKTDPASADWAGIVGNLMNYIRPSDLIDSGRIIVNRAPREEIIAPVLHSLGRDNMPGFDYGVARGRLIPRIDTADSFAQHTLDKKYHDQGMRNANELAAKNTAFVEQRRQQNLAIANKNLASNVGAVNENTRATNRAEAIYTKEYNQALAAKTQDDQKRKMQIINGVSSYAFNASKRIRERDLAKQYNHLSTVKNIWATEYQPRVDAAVHNNKMDDVKKIKTDFILNQHYDPDDLNNQILDLRSQFKGLQS